jgi:peptide/nickel transport system substrate-binding protein
MRKINFAVVLVVFALLAGAEAGAAGLKDTVTYAQTSDLTSLDPHIGKQMRAFAVTCNMFEQLVKFDKDMKTVIPSLAVSWERLSDTEMRFHLRKGVKWHNGDDFTAADVKFSYDRMLSMPIVVNNIAFLESSRIEDDYTIVLKTKYPYAPLLAALTNPPCAIVPKKVVEADPKNFALHPVGTGPYKFVEWKPAEYCRLEAFDGYWGDKAKTKYLVMKVVPESTQRSIMLETGELDVGYEIPPVDVQRIADNEKLKMDRVVSNKTFFLNMNTQSKGPLGNKLVRQAIAYAIDREEILNGIMNGIGSLANLPIPPGAFGYDPDFKGANYDLAKAKELMKQAGYEKGFECSIWIEDDQVASEIATTLQSQLLELNINLKIDVMKQATMQSLLYKHQDFDMNYAFFNCNIGDGDYNLYSCFHPDSKSNHCYFNNEQCTKLIEQSRAAYDDNVRRGLYQQIFTILQDEMPCIPLYYEEICVGSSKKVEGLELSKIGAHKYNHVVVSE